MSDKEMRDKLDEMEDTWQEDSEKGGTDLPLGKHIGRVQSAELKIVGDEDDLAIVASYLVLDDTHQCAGEIGTDFIRCSGEWGRTFTRQWIEKMGFEYPARARDLPDVVEAIDEAKPGIGFRVFEKDGYTNTRILRRIPDEELPDLPEGFAAGAKAETAEKAETTPSPVSGLPLTAGVMVGCKDKDGSDTTGEIIKVMSSGNLRIKTITGNTVSRPPDDVWVSPPEEEEEEEQDDDDVESGVAKEDADLRAELEGFCITHYIEFDDSDTDDDLKELINGAAPFKQSELVDQEIDLLKQLDVEVENDAKPTKGKGKTKVTRKAEQKTDDPQPTPEKTREEMLNDLKKVARAFGVTVPRNITLAKFRDKMNKECEFTRSDLSDDEAQALENAGVELVEG